MTRSILLAWLVTWALGLLVIGLVVAAGVLAALAGGAL